jgi:uncharacterized protein
MNIYKANNAVMNTVIDALIAVLLASWNVLLESAPFVLLGFVVAGLLKAFLPDDFVANHLGGGSTASIFKAAAMGVPIPLCSCGVLPAAAGLKKQGAGKGAVTSFLISTPETGVDSIAVSWALLDPLMTVIRPVVAFFTAIAAGIAVSFTEKRQETAIPEAAPEQQNACTSGCCCSHREPEPEGVAGKFTKGMRFAFGDLLKDIGGWLFFGILLSGVISVFLSPEIVSRYLSNEYLSMLLMLAISVPLYVCATASTPIAAALALKGISPGAALVFLLAGPATNAAAITVISKLIGRQATIVYVAVIVVMSFLAGIGVNALYASLGISITGWLTASAHEEGGPVAILSALVLIVLVAKAMLPKKS